MSDGLWVALITALATTVGPVILAIVNHHLGKRDRDLASKTMMEKNRQLRGVKATNRRLARENTLLKLRRSRPRRRR